MSVSGRNRCDRVNFTQDIAMIIMNVKQAYSEWYDTESDKEIDNMCILREMIEVRGEGFKLLNVLSGDTS